MLKEISSIYQTHQFRKFRGTNYKVDIKNENLDYESIDLGDEGVISTYSDILED